MKSSSKEWLINSLIATGIFVNAIVIVLILYYVVF